MVDIDFQKKYHRIDSALELRRLLSSDEGFRLDDVQMRSLVRDLHQVKTGIYWVDLIACAVIGWLAFAATVFLPLFSPGMLLSAAISIFALYRGLCFIHEISHQNARTLPGFETVWNFLIGFPLLMPSFVYSGVHNDHHKLTMYGTAGDPEYLPFAHSARMTVVFIVESFLIPAAQLIRFVVSTPIGLIVPPFQEWLVTHASSLTMNVRYRRIATPALVNTVRRGSAMILLIWVLFIAAAVAGIIPLRAFGIWFAITACASFVNTLRTLGAHAYESSGAPLDREGQLIDSIDTPGRFWTELWAPVGLRYHALHHYFPGIPYHNLPEAYRRFTDTLPIAKSYSRMSNPSLPYSLRSLLKKGLRPWS